MPPASPGARSRGGSASVPLESQYEELFAEVAHAMIPHLAGRPVTRKRWPDGVSTQPFFHKDLPKGTPTSEVLMVRTHKWSDLWGIPGGKIKWGESSVAALRREIREETALRITGIRFVLAQDCIHSKEFYRDAHFILLNYTCRCVGPPRVKLNEEGREFRWVTPAQALAMPVNGPTRVLLKAISRTSTRGNSERKKSHHVQDQHR